MYNEDELLPLSAVQHLLFCERQCALIHVEQQWRDNRFTLEGARLHSRVDEDGPRRELRGDTAILRGLALRSLRLGLRGIADVVELRGAREDRPLVVEGLARAVRIDGLDGFWSPYPVDYKRGKPKLDACDEVQLCAQAICLEESFDVRVPEGAIFYGRQKRRHIVMFEERLRAETEATAGRLHRLIESGETPAAQREAKCENCSLLGICLPEAMSKEMSAREYLESSIQRE